VRAAYYLHGFASSARSTKAALFGERLTPAGITWRCPDFNEPAFETLTASRMVGQLEADMAALPPGPIALIGSSLGGFVAVLAAARQARRRAANEHVSHPVDRLVLLAPALDFGRTDYGAFTPAEMSTWRQTGRLEIFHYGDNCPRVIGFGLHEDAQQYDALAERVAVPTLVFQGRRDAAVSPAMVQGYYARQPLASVRMFDDDHLLMGHISVIVRETAAFLGVNG